MFSRLFRKKPDASSTDAGVPRILTPIDDLPPSIVEPKKRYSLLKTLSSFSPRSAKKAQEAADDSPPQNRRAISFNFKSTRKSGEASPARSAGSVRRSLSLTLLSGRKATRGAEAQASDVSSSVAYPGDSPASVVTSLGFREEATVMKPTPPAPTAVRYSTATKKAAEVKVVAAKVVEAKVAERRDVVAVSDGPRPGKVVEVEARIVAQRRTSSADDCDPLVNPDARFRWNSPSSTPPGQRANTPTNEPSTLSLPAPATAPSDSSAMLRPVPATFASGRSVEESCVNPSKLFADKVARPRLIFSSPFRPSPSSPFASPLHILCWPPLATLLWPRLSHPPFACCAHQVARRIITAALANEGAAPKAAPEAEAKQIAGEILRGALTKHEATADAAADAAEKAADAKEREELANLHRILQTEGIPGLRAATKASELKELHAVLMAQGMPGLRAATSAKAGKAGKQPASHPTSAPDTASPVDAAAAKAAKEEAAEEAAMERALSKNAARKKKRRLAKQASPSHPLILPWPSSPLLLPFSPSHGPHPPHPPMALTLLTLPWPSPSSPSHGPYPPHLPWPSPSSPSLGPHPPHPPMALALLTLPLAGAEARGRRLRR